MNSDEEIIQAQIGRPIQRKFYVAAKCHLSLPVVVGGSETTDDGRPFPTRFWLSCPLAVKRISKLESSGAIQALDQRIRDDSDFAQSMTAAHDAHDDQVDSGPRRGIGGTRAWVKCLHAHAAYQLAGGTTPAGEWAVQQIGELDCSVACVTCVIGDDGNSAIKTEDGIKQTSFRRNPQWRASAAPDP